MPARKGPVHSAGLLAYQLEDGAQAGLWVFLAHMGGPYWARRDAGGWSIPKGEFDPTTDEPAAAAAREFAEEIGVAAPPEPWLDLGQCRQPSGKIITTYAVAAPRTLRFRESNLFQLPWPPGSGELAWFPEVDRADRFPLQVARTKLVAGQRPILDELASRLGRDRSGPRETG